MKSVSLVVAILAVIAAKASAARGDDGSVLKRAIIVSGENMPTEEDEQARLTRIQQVLENIPKPALGDDEEEEVSAEAAAAGVVNAEAAGEESADEADAIDADLNQGVDEEIKKLEFHITKAKKFADKLPALEDRLKQLKAGQAGAADAAAKAAAQKALEAQQKTLEEVEAKIAELKRSLKDLKAHKKQLVASISASEAMINGTADDSDDPCLECEEKKAEEGAAAPAAEAPVEEGEAAPAAEAPVEEGEAAPAEEVTAPAYF